MPSVCFSIDPQTGAEVDRVLSELNHEPQVGEALDIGVNDRLKRVIIDRVVPTPDAPCDFDVFARVDR